MNKPLMPKATALWLLDNTGLTFEQIADFCGFHLLEVESLSNDIKRTLHPLSPLESGQLTTEEIMRCEKDPSLRLKMCKPPIILESKKKAKYTPLSKRSDVPSAILFLLRAAPSLTDAQICKLLSTTKTTVKSIREGTRAHFKEMIPKDPVLLGLCRKEDLDFLLNTHSD